MIRGIIPFKCDECGKIFLAPDVEYGATAYSCPQECPRCHSMHTLPAGALTWLQRWFYKRIWNSH